MSRGILTISSRAQRRPSADQIRNGRGGGGGNDALVTVIGPINEWHRGVAAVSVTALTRRKRIGRRPCMREEGGIGRKRVDGKTRIERERENTIERKGER